jgi:hypothetical protein
VSAQTAPGCAAENKTAPSIAGAYVDNFGGFQTVSTDFWISGSLVFEVCSVDETKRQIVARGHPLNDYNPGKFTRFDFVTYGDNVWYCQPIADAVTEQDAAAAPAPDASNPALGGCGTFRWSALVPRPK